MPISRKVARVVHTQANPTTILILANTILNASYGIFFFCYFLCTNERVLVAVLPTDSVQTFHKHYMPQTLSRWPLSTLNSVGSMGLLLIFRV